MDPDLKLALDKVSFWQGKVARRFHKNAKKLATWNLWAAEDVAQHIAEAYQYGVVERQVTRGIIDFPLPVYSGDKLHMEDD